MILQERKATDTAEGQRGRKAVSLLGGRPLGGEDYEMMVRLAADGTPMRGEGLTGGIKQVQRKITDPTRQFLQRKKRNGGWQKRKSHWIRE